MFECRGDPEGILNTYYYAIYLFFGQKAHISHILRIFSIFDDFLQKSPQNGGGCACGGLPPSAVAGQLLFEPRASVGGVTLVLSTAPLLL